jgi:5-methylthioadenosine/S-adenosylhomocysteine deaminase
MDTRAPLLIRGAQAILTINAQRAIVRNQSVLIEDGCISQIGDSAALDRSHLELCRREGTVVEAAGCVLVPAYINTHVHTVEHLSRGLIPDDLSTFDWASQYATPFCASLTEQEAYVSARLACLEMISNGTGCFVDVNILASLGHLDAVAQAVEESGMRAILGRGVTDLLADSKAKLSKEMVDAVWHSSTKGALAEVNALLDRGLERADGRIRIWASIYGLMFYTSDDLFRGIARIAQERGVPLAFHIASSREEARFCKTRTGRWPISHLAKLGVLSERTLLTHCTLISDSEVELLAAHGSKVAFCPGAALRLAKGTTQVGKIPEMLKAGVTVSLGADGTSSSGTFDPLRLAFLAAGLFKDARLDPTLVPAETALELITIEGAKATQSADIIGSIEVGKRADITLYDMSGPEWAPGHDLVRTLIYSVDGRSVHTVIVDGRVIYAGGAALGFDNTSVIDEAHECGQRIAHRLQLDARPRWPLND